MSAPAPGGPSQGPPSNGVATPQVFAQQYQAVQGGAMAQPLFAQQAQPPSVAVASTAVAASSMQPTFTQKPNVQPPTTTQQPPQGAVMQSQADDGKGSKLALQEWFDELDESDSEDRDSMFDVESDEEFVGEDGHVAGDGTSKVSCTVCFPTINASATFPFVI